MPALKMQSEIDHVVTLIIIITMVTTQSIWSTIIVDHILLTYL